MSVRLSVVWAMTTLNAASSAWRRVTARSLRSPCAMVEKRCTAALDPGGAGSRFSSPASSEPSARQTA